MNRWLWIVLLLPASACGTAAPEGKAGAADGEANAANEGAAAEAARGESADDEAGFSSRVAVLLLADSAILEAMRADWTEEDYHVVADDLMWYRSEAWNWLEERGVRVVAREGRPPLRFHVGGDTHVYDFSSETTADVVVLYEPGREPRAVAPIDVPETAAAYFGLAPR